MYTHNLITTNILYFLNINMVIIGLLILCVMYLFKDFIAYTIGYYRYKFFIKKIKNTQFVSPFGTSEEIKKKLDSLRENHLELQRQSDDCFKKAIERFVMLCNEYQKNGDSYETAKEKALLDNEIKTLCSEADRLQKEGWHQTSVAILGENYKENFVKLEAEKN